MSCNGGAPAEGNSREGHRAEVVRFCGRTLFCAIFAALEFAFSSVYWMIMNAVKLVKWMRLVKLIRLV